MYISAGTRWIQSDDLIGIFDLDITSQSYLTREYLKKAESRGSVINASEDIPKTFTVCYEKGKNNSKKPEKIYLSQVSPAVLRSRVEQYNKANNNFKY